MAFALFADVCRVFFSSQFAAKADGSVCDVGDMTYAEVAQRMIRLMYVAHEKRWIDPSLKKLTGDWLRRVSGDNKHDGFSPALADQAFGSSFPRI